MFSRAERLRHMAAGCLKSAADAKKYGGEAESNKLNIAHYDAQAAALLAGAEALERTTPEPISEKHQNGNWWLVCLDGVWMKGYFDVRWGSWRISPSRWLSEAPTHALPMPPVPPPESQDRTGEMAGEVAQGGAGDAAGQGGK